VTWSSRSAHLSYFSNTLFVALFEPRDIEHALSDLSWVNAMHEELVNFKRNQVWTLVEPPRDVNIIGTKWVFKNKQGNGEIMRNKVRLIAQGFSQVEGLDFEETFAHVARLETIRILLAFAASKGFKLYQMDVKSAFLNGVIQKEVYIRQPPGFENLKYPNRVYKFSKALYELKQAPRAWYARLKTFLLEHVYVMESVDKTLFTLNHDIDFLLVQIYMDDIIFGASSHSLVSSFQEMMESEFQMSMMGELTFFLGIQVKQIKQFTFVHQAKYTKDLMKKFNMVELKPLSTPMSMAIALDPNDNGETVDQREYRSLIGSLLYLIAIRPNIQFTVRLLCAFSLPHALHTRRLFSESSCILNTLLSLGFGILLLLRLILLAFTMLILRVVGLTERALLILVIFSDPLLFVGLLANHLLLHSPPLRLSI
jgi:hypothetical protein